MIAVIDVDDVLLDWTQGFDKWVRVEYGYVGIPISQRQDRLFDLFHNEIYNEFNQSNQFESLNLIKDADIGLIEISKQFDIKLITSCGEQYYKYRKFNLDLYLSNINYELIVLPLHKSKYEYIDKYKPTIFIDDNIENVKYHADSLTGNTFLFHTEFNSSFNYKNINRVYTWMEIIKKL